MKKFKLVGLTGQDTVPEIQLENFEFDRKKDHVIAFTVDVTGLASEDVPKYMQKVRRIVRPAFPKRVKLLFIPKRGHNETGIYKVL